MKQVPFYANHEDDNHCMVAAYRSIFDYFLGKKLSWEEADEFVGYRNGRAAWTLAPLTKMAAMGFDVHMIEPFDYREFAKRGRGYLEDAYSKEKAEWTLAHTDILDIKPSIPEFLKSVNWENRRPTFADIDKMLDEDRLVFVTLNSRALNDHDGYVTHAVLILGREDSEYIIHDSGLPPHPYRRVPRQKLWLAMGGDTNTAEATGIKLKDQTGGRLDQYISSRNSQISRNTAAKLIKEGSVLVNGKSAKASYKLHAADRVQLNYDVNNSKGVALVHLPVLYEDDDCVVINKPAGVLTHSKGAFNPEATVATFLAKKVKGMDGERAGIVHRLDRATSGVMICAKTPGALSWLQKQFSQRKVKKTYMAVISGALGPEHAIIDMPIERNPKAPATFRVGANGKSAVTEYWVEKSSKRYNLVKLMPKTGRTHQLRVHLKQLGHPIVGDIFYAGEPAERFFLHALSLEITLPDRTRQTFTAPLPNVFDRKLGAQT